LDVSSTVGFSLAVGCFVGLFCGVMLVEDESGIMGVDEGFMFGLVVSWLAFGLNVGVAFGFSGLDVGIGVGELFGETVGVGVGAVDGAGDVNGSGEVEGKGVGSGVTEGVGIGEGEGRGVGAMGASGSSASRMGK
jgi:hypothetical protein